MPLKQAKVDMSAALKRWSETAVVHEIPNLKRAFVIAPKTPDEDVVIKTDGVNIEAMFPFAETLDLNRLYCNDVHAVARHYGVEAASRVIVKVNMTPPLGSLCNLIYICLSIYRRCETSSTSTALRSIRAI